MEIRFDAQGLVPVVTQDAATGQVLMLAWADREAVDATLETGQAHYHSRSRGTLWRKGATSGNTQRVLGVRLDCDGDALLYQVEQTGPACHTGEVSCFHNVLADAGDLDTTSRATRLLDSVIAQRMRDRPEGSYVTELLERGEGYAAQKVVEEAGETVVAALQNQLGDLAGEAADLLFHLTVLLHLKGLSLRDPARVLLERNR